MAASYLRWQLEESPRHEHAPSVAPFRVSTVVRDMPIRNARLRSNPSFMERNDELRNIPGAVPNKVDGYTPDGAMGERCYVNDLCFMLAVAGLDYEVTPGANGTNEVQTVTITGAPTGGTFTLTFAGQTTAPIPHNATAAQVRAALEALSNIAVGDVACAGGPLPATAVTVTFQGELGFQNVAQMTAAGSFTGGSSPGVSVATTTAGALGAVLDPDGRTIPAGAQRYVYTPRTNRVARTAQLIAGYGTENPPVYLRGQGYGINNLTLNAAGELGNDMTGLVCGRIEDPQIAPNIESETILPIQRGGLFLTWLAGSGTTEDFNLGLTNPLNARSTLSKDPPSFFPDALEHGDEWPRLAGAMPKTSFDPDDWDAFVNGTTFAGKARWRSQSAISGTPAANRYRFSLFSEMPAIQYTDGDPDELANRRRFGFSPNWWAAYDEASGFAFKFTLVGSVPALETYV